MPKQLIINAIEPREIRAAIIEDGSAANFFVERSTRKFQKGNIYRARVTSIEPHLQAAFVELEKGQHGFLSLSDVIFPDGGISLAKGLPAPPMPEPSKKKKDGDDQNRNSEKKTGDSSDLAQNGAKSKKDSSNQNNDFVIFPEPENHEPPAALTFPEPPPATRLSQDAGQWLLGISSSPIRNIVEIEDEGWELGVEICQRLDERPPSDSPTEILSDLEQDQAEGEERCPEKNSAAECSPPEKTPETKAHENSVEDTPAPSELTESVPQSSQEPKTDDQSESDTEGEQNDSNLDSDDISVDTAIFELDGDEVPETTAIEKQKSIEQDDDIDDLEDSENEAKSNGGKKGSSKTGRSDGANKKNKHNAPQRRRRPNLRIEEVLEIGQYLMVQITKEGIGNKAPMVTTFLSCAGHYMVLTPGGDRSGVSKQVRSPKERKRLREFIEDSPIPERCGLIVRTAAEGIEMEELQNDIRRLSNVWDELRESYKRSSRSGLLRKEDELSTRLVRDYYNQDIEEVWVDAPDVYHDIRDFFKRAIPDELERVKLYEGNRPIFTHHDLNQPLEELFRRRVNLPGGGSLIFDQGEAMLVIDINSGTFKEGDDDEDTAFRLNMLACKELARQIQMRDVGGIIMIDFVDMRRISSRNKVERELEKCFRGDKAKLNIMSIGALGVLQMSRQRTKDSLRGSLYTSCPHCDGSGLVPSKTHSAMGILREIRGNLKRLSGSQIKIATTAEMATEMFNSYKGEIVKMEEEESCQIILDIDPKMGHGQFKLINRGGRGNSRSDEQQRNNQNSQKKKRRRKDENSGQGKNNPKTKTNAEQNSSGGSLGVIADNNKAKTETKDKAKQKNNRQQEKTEAKKTEHQDAKKDEVREEKNVGASNKTEDLKKTASDQTAPPPKGADGSKEEAKE